MVSWVYPHLEYHFLTLSAKGFTTAVKVGQRYGCFYFLGEEVEIKRLITKENKKTQVLKLFMYDLSLHTRAHAHTQAHSCAGMTQWSWFYQFLIYR